MWRGWSFTLLLLNCNPKVGHPFVEIAHKGCRPLHVQKDPRQNFSQKSVRAKTGIHKTTLTPISPRWDGGAVTTNQGAIQLPTHGHAIAHQARDPSCRTGLCDVRRTSRHLRSKMKPSYIFVPPRRGFFSASTRLRASSTACGQRTIPKPSSCLIPRMNPSASQR